LKRAAAVLRAGSWWMIAGSKTTAAAYKGPKKKEG
jgi:hypothetical protein